jgi:hypothetical protein
MGNEPQFCCSFGSGLALRIWLASDSVKSNFMYQMLSAKWFEAMTGLGFTFDQVDELLTNPGGGKWLKSI